LAGRRKSRSKASRNPAGWKVIITKAGEHAGVLGPYTGKGAKARAISDGQAFADAAQGGVQVRVVPVRVNRASPSAGARRNRGSGGRRRRRRRNSSSGGRWSSSAGPQQVVRNAGGKAPHPSVLDDFRLMVDGQVEYLGGLTRGGKQKVRFTYTDAGGRQRTVTRSASYPSSTSKPFVTIAGRSYMLLPGYRNNPPARANPPGRANPGGRRRRRRRGSGAAAARAAFDGLRRNAGIAPDLTPPASRGLPIIPGADVQGYVTIPRPPISTTTSGGPPVSPRGANFPRIGNPAGGLAGVRYVHKISPRDSDRAGPFRYEPGDLDDVASVRRWLKRHGINAAKGARHGRRTAEGFVIFPPRSSIWHSVRIERQ